MTTLHWMPGGVPNTVELLEPEVDEVIAAVPHAPPAAFPAAPRRQHTPRPEVVIALRGELGIREPDRAIRAPERHAGYGPTSFLSEGLLLRGYGLEDDA